MPKMSHFQIEYLFSDKTGTLTENVMVFKECSIGGVKFADQMENLVCIDYQNSEKLNERSVRKFLEVLALCHTVQAASKRKDETRTTDDINDESTTTTAGSNPFDLIYSAASPDEKAIVEACRNYGVAFLGKQNPQNSR